MWKKSVQKPYDYIVFLLALILSYFDIVSSVIVVILSAVSGIIYTLCKKGGNEK